MGATLPKAVEATVVERHQMCSFKVGVAEMNGWRNSMEDSHLIKLRADWGFFGVFDGHGGTACSAYVAKRLDEEIEKNGCPKDDAAVKKLVLGIDKEFLDSEEPSGSTGTMCIVEKPNAAGGKHRLRVINIGDSRVLLGHLNGTIVDGNGTDQGLTTDHKPDHPSERERIYRCGGTVVRNEGNVARVNGDLAVSRCFGDREYKRTGGPAPEDHPVTADPEMAEFECDENHFLLLVCDGVSEGNFPNPEVVSFAAEQLRENGNDVGAAAKAVCHKAVERDSKDNITCMIVLLSGSASETKNVDFYPSTISHFGNKSFRNAYEVMANKAGLTLAEAVEARYEFLIKDAAMKQTQSVKEELAKIGKPTTDQAGKARSKYFSDWLHNLAEDKDDGPGGIDLSSLMGMAAGAGFVDVDLGGVNGLGGDAAGGTGGLAETFKAAEDDNEAERNEDGYTWSQNGGQVEISFKLSRNTQRRDVQVDFQTDAVKVIAHGKPLLDGTLGGKVKVDECNWGFGDAGSELLVMLSKIDTKDHWKGLLL
eukprot:TRINITY_DN6216_c1_g3_i1.p1 TRINITY_DN6216_c1_g3~~TRINITY_DN6216_c1_g3_i1.p1  ORF type:complete len:536 (+),score=127.35 TRINITY_DN6216_c1_g3_i1:73-1680(+)